tara:strand:- start:1957 stop:3633 length:1677 start_codon:yes stop_codon:yes gene_type:complete
MIRIIVILFLLNINCLYSQSNEGEIEDAQILIEKNSKIILPKVDKSINKISLENKTISKKTFEFESIKFVDFSSKKKIDKILRDNTSYKETKNIFIDVKGGNYSTFIINTNPYFKSGNKFALYSDIFIKLNSKGSKLSSVSGEEINDINFFADYKYSNSSRISSHFNFNSFSNGYYGFIDDENIILNDDLIEKLRFTNNSFIYKIDWENIGKKYNLSISYTGEKFKNSFYNEFQNTITSNISIPLSNTLISFIPKFDNYQLDQINNQNINNQNKLTITKLDLPVLFNFSINNLNITLNSLYQYLSRSYLGKSNVSSFSPSIKFRYYNKKLTINLSASRGFNHNKYSQEINLMPFLYEKGISNQFDFNKELYRIKTGIDLSVFNNSSLTLGFESLKVNANLNYVLYKGESLPSEIKAPMYIYTIERENITQVINYLTFNYSARFSNNIESSINFLHSIFEEIQVFQPKYEIDVLNTYKKNKISFSLGANFKLENYGLNYKSELFKMKSYVNVFLDGSYKISDNLDFNFHLNNILNRYNERFFMYPELGLNFLVGIKWVF